MPELYSRYETLQAFEVKTTKAFYLVILYTLAMCKPVLPLVQDELAHMFWKARHLQTVHHHHGHHHAQEEVAKAAQEEQNDKHAATSKPSEPIAVHIFSHTIYKLPQPFLRKEKYRSMVSSVTTISLDKHYPPPKSC
jgi:hypothetical protein